MDGAGLQLIPALTQSEASQIVPLPSPVSSFDVSQLGAPATTDKVGKDDSFRGLTLYNNVLYVTKGTGGNGVNTVYFVDTTGTARARSPLPTTNLAPSYNPTTGLANSMCVVAGFPTAINKLTGPVAYPFGLWFANATTLYVADEGNGTNTYSAATNTYTAASATTNTGGLQKWTFSAATQTWQLAYTLKAGLNLGTLYTVAGYPTGLNDGVGGTGLPYAPATDGLRNIIRNRDRDRESRAGTQRGYLGNIFYGQRQRRSGRGPNKLYLITDRLSNTSAAFGGQEMFTDLRDANSGGATRNLVHTGNARNLVLTYRRIGFLSSQLHDPRRERRQGHVPHPLGGPGNRGTREQRMHPLPSLCVDGKLQTELSGDRSG